MRRYCLSILMLIVLPVTTVLANNDYQNWWSKANKHYEQKQYERALYYYNEVAKLDPSNAVVYYNLGNTYYRLNDIGHAVLNYEKALHLQPDYTEASDNLYLAQNRIDNRIPQMPEIFFVRWWKAITQPGLTNIYAVIALLLFMSGIGYYMLEKLGRTNLKLPVQLPVSVFILSAIFIILGISSGNRRAASGLGVIIAEGTPMMAEPKYGKSISLIPEGTTVEIHNQKTDWYEITLPDGRNGWIQQNSMEKV